MDGFSNQAKIPLIFISILVLLNLIVWADQCNPQDKIALLKIKEQFGNPSWTNPWNTSTDCCTTWSDSRVVTINCDDLGRVIELTISGVNDISKIPPAIGHLASLEQLTISEAPHLYGQIPASSICKLANLTSLTLQITNLTGPIPDCLSQLKNLKYIALASSGFTGPIPPSLVQIPILSSVFLRSNQLSGPIPDFPTQVSYLNLGENNLSGPIPASIEKLSNLTLLDLSHNQLSGSLLPSIGLLSSLYVLDLSNNRFNGSIPESFGSFKEPGYFLLQNNKLTGRVPKSLGRLNMTWVNISRNQFIGDASFLFGLKKSSTYRIFLNNNMFTFDFSSVELPQYLFELNISHNKIYGSLPKEVANMSTFDASYNNLCGRIPSGSAKFGAAAFAHNNCLCGSPLPACK